MRLPTTYQEYIHLSRYARWDYDLKRRETWDETVGRYFNFFTEWLEEKNDYKLENGERIELENAVKELNVMPSMRCLMTAGPALKKENVAGYNCSYIKVDSPRSFDEILYVLMNGTGVGFSVEQEYTNQLPVVPEELYDTDTVIESITAVTIWKDFGLTVVLFIAGLQAIDKQFYQAAQIDGANSWEQFYNITLPLLQPVFLLVLITTIIDSFNVFTAILIMTSGGPAEGSTTIVHQIYSNAFIYLKMGRAAAMSMTLLILVTFLSIPVKS